MNGKWKWKVSGYYGDNVVPPRRPGMLALETVHADDFSKDLEIKIFETRSDIGRIEVNRLTDLLGS